MGPVVTKADEILEERGDALLSAGITTTNSATPSAPCSQPCEVDPSYVMAQLGHYRPEV